MSDIDVVKDMFERGIIKCRLSNLSITNCKRFKEKADFNFNLWDKTEAEKRQLQDRLDY